jgi:PKD repeat protein
VNFGDFNYFESLYPFSQMSTFIPVDEGEINFIVSQPWEYADYCGYLVKGPAGTVLVDQDTELTAPESTFGITACEAGADPICNAEFEIAQITSPDGSPVPGAVQVSIFDYNPNAVYTWDFGDEGTSTDVFPTYQYSGPGPYTLCLNVTDGNLCSDSYCEPISIDSLGLLNGFLSGFTINVVDGGPSDVVSSVNNLTTSTNALSVFPNPAQGQVTLVGMEPGANWVGDLRSTDGRLVRRFNGVGQSPLSLDGVAEGLYILNVVDGTSSSRTVRVIVQ